MLPKRFGKYGLTLHPKKTGLVPFQRPPRRSARKDSTEGSQPGSFDLLGFTHYWSLWRKGNWVVKRKTAKSRLTRALRRVAQWCRTHRHQPIREQHRPLSPEAQRALRVLRNHGQRFRVGHVPPRGDADLAQVAVPPTSTGWLPVATILSAAGALCARTVGRGPLGVPSRSEPVT